MSSYLTLSLAKPASARSARVTPAVALADPVKAQQGGAQDGTKDARQRAIFGRLQRNDSEPSASAASRRRESRTVFTNAAQAIKDAGRAALPARIRSRAIALRSSRSSRPASSGAVFQPQGQTDCDVDP
jgi:hypothetical protein